MSSLKLDGFSWSEVEKKLNEIIERKVEERIIAANKEVEELRDENLTLNLEVAELQKRVEALDRNSKRASIIVKGLKIYSPKEFFINLCEELLGETIEIVDYIKLPSGDFIFQLATVEQARNILNKRREFKGTCFVNRNFTRIERNKNYNLRTLGKKLNASKTAKVRVGDFSLFVNNKNFTWYNGSLAASNDEDAKMINEVLKECNVDMICTVFSRKRASPKNNKRTQDSKGACFVN